MTETDVWQEVVNLSNNVFGVTSGLDLPRCGEWASVVAVFLVQSNERLDSVRILLNKDYWNSATILTRSLFELAANLVYIAKDADSRLPKYLKHGGVPLDEQDTESLQSELAQARAIRKICVEPKRVWKPLRGICCDLGQSWSKEYDTFYAVASWPTHAGSSLIPVDYLRLRNHGLLSERERAKLLVTALAFHLRVAKVAVRVFPRQMSSPIVDRLASECGSLGWTLRLRD